MAIIGTFTRENTGFTGLVRTLSFTASVTIEPVSAKRGDRSPTIASSVSLPALAKLVPRGSARRAALHTSPSASTIRPSRLRLTAASSRPASSTATASSGNATASVPNSKPGQPQSCPFFRIH